MPSPAQMRSRLATSAVSGTRRKSKRWQRESDRRRHLVRVGRRQDEDDVRRRLLERLEQRVERRVGQHVHLVDEVDLVLRRRRARSRPCRGGCVSRRCRGCSRASISIRSMARPAEEERHDSHSLQGSPSRAVGAVERLGAAGGPWSSCRCRAAPRTGRRARRGRLPGRWSASS